MSTRAESSVRAVYEHPFMVRLCHWLTAISLTLMIGSGIEIFRAFPSFSTKIPENDIADIPSWLGVGGWLGGALQLHYAFMWVFAGAGLLYVGSQIATRNYKQVLFALSDIHGVWPMFRHYFLFGPKPHVSASYNPLQKLAYTLVIVTGLLSLITGVALSKPIQFAWLVQLLGGFGLVRLEHFLAMLGFLAFIPGHLIMVLLHGWSNFASMLSGWKLEGEDRLPKE
jgi:Ni/Fe-hydrogenase b-type cytochrome subunit